MLKPTVLTIGKIVCAHGLKGEVKILSLTDYPARFRAGLSICTYPLLPGIDELKIESVKGTSKNILIKLKGVDTREDAEKLKGLLVQIPIEKDTPLPEGTYWQHEIIGLKVITVDGKLIGYVTDIMRTGNNDIYVVALKEKEYLIPAIKDIVKKIDLKNGLMLINVMDGLLE